MKSHTSKLVSDLKQQATATLRQVAALQTAINPLTPNSLEGKRWDISSMVCEHQAQAEKSLILLRELIEDAEQYWPD